jgi:glycosyltransferase involved in cell wall biosynthesis
MGNFNDFVIVTPCFNEGTTLISFLKRLEGVVSRLDEKFMVVVVDDASLDNSLELAKSFSFTAPNIQLHLIQLMYNTGHQSAIFQGMLYAKKLDAQRVIIMDSDGEDDPEAIPSLVQNTDYDIVVVNRGKRKENFTFRFSYAIYKRIFTLITGKKMDHGNYSMISKKMVERIANTSFIHYPAYLLKQKATRTNIVFDRDKRIDGKSKMGMKGLLFHAFRSFIEFAEDLLLLFLRMFIVISIAIVLLFLNVLYQKLVAKTAILGWFSTLSISLVILATICLGFFVTGLLLLNLMHQQNNKTQSNIYNIIKS